MLCTPVITRTPETSESATNKFSPSVASPLGWAKLADAAGPSTMFSCPEPANTRPVGGQVELPDLVRTGHCNIECLVPGYLNHVPWAAEQGGLGRPRMCQSEDACAWLPMPAIVRDLAFLQFDLADGVVLGVGDVESLAGQVHALRAVERRLLEIAIVKAFFTAADRDRVGAIEVGLNDPIMAGIGDEQSLAGRRRRPLFRETRAARPRTVPFRA